MTSQKPPPRPSKAPPRRETVEVQLEWLEEEDTKKSRSKKKPPPLPNARVQAPPMPVMPSKPPPAPRKTKPPPPRNTMEVDLRELIIVPKMPLPPLLRPTRPAGKPIPREEDDAPAPRQSKPPPSRRSKPPPR